MSNAKLESRAKKAMTNGAKDEISLGRIVTSTARVSIVHNKNTPFINKFFSYMLFDVVRRSKRSIGQFGRMIRLTTQTEALLFNNYGNHCGSASGADAPVIDAIDA